MASSSPPRIRIAASGPPSLNGPRAPVQRFARGRGGPGNGSLALAAKMRDAKARGPASGPALGCGRGLRGRGGEEGEDGRLLRRQPLGLVGGGSRELQPPVQ